MRKNILAVLQAFEHGRPKGGESCHTDGETIYSYALPIVRRWAGGYMIREANSTKTTNSQIYACVAYFRGSTIVRRESL